jgi:adenine-specific DNA-methyltransferase
MLEPEFLRLKDMGRIHWGKDGNGVPRTIRYLSDVDGLVPWTWWPHDEVGHTDEARKEIREWLETQTAFETPKPVRLMERVLQIAAPGKDDLVLDFFAGSGTTAHAVRKMNAADGGQRRCILVSNTEATPEEPEKNLCRDVCAKRVRRVIEGYNGTPGLGGDFAYLRCRRIEPGSLVEIDHAQVWNALQMIHCETLAPFVDQPFLWAGSEDETVLYVPRFRRRDVAAIRKQARQSAAVTLYSWQPGLLRQYVPDAHVQHEPIPASLARRFGV